MFAVNFIILFLRKLEKLNFSLTEYKTKHNVLQTTYKRTENDKMLNHKPQKVLYFNNKHCFFY